MLSFPQKIRDIFQNPFWERRVCFGEAPVEYFEKNIQIEGEQESEIRDNTLDVWKGKDKINKEDFEDHIKEVQKSAVKTFFSVLHTAYPDRCPSVDANAIKNSQKEYTQILKDIVSSGKDEKEKNELTAEVNRIRMHMNALEEGKPVLNDAEEVETKRANAYFKDYLDIISTFSTFPTKKDGPNARGMLKNPITKESEEQYKEFANQINNFLGEKMIFYQSKKSKYPGIKFKCLIPNSNGVQYRHLSLSKLWDKYYTNGLERRKPQEKKFRKRKEVL